MQNKSNTIGQHNSILGQIFSTQLSELCIPVSTSAGRHFMRSATYGDLLVPRTSTSKYGPRSFAVSGPSVWNKLPATLRVSPTLGQFQSKLKAVLFRSAYETCARVPSHCMRCAHYDTKVWTKNCYKRFIGQSL